MNIMIMALPWVNDTAFTSLCYVPPASAQPPPSTPTPWLSIDLVSQPALPLS